MCGCGCQIAVLDLDVNERAAKGSQAPEPEADAAGAAVSAPAAVDGEDQLRRSTCVNSRAESSIWTLINRSVLARRIGAVLARAPSAHGTTRAGLT